MNGQCTCDISFTGVDCSLPKKCHEACAGVCLPERKLTSSPCEVCKGQCLTLSLSPVLGKHNPRRDPLGLVQHETSGSHSQEARRYLRHRHTEVSATSSVHWP